MITITNKNIYYGDFSISTLSTLDGVEIIDPSEIINFLTEDVELGESLKFKRLFDIISYNIGKFNEIFFSALGGYSLEPYLQEIENNPTEKFQSDYLEIFWACDKYEDELNIYPSLHGVSIKENEYYAMDFVSLNNLKDYNLKLNREVEFFDYVPFEKIDENIKKITLGNKTFTLFDLYNAIFHEITFHGGPQDKKERFEELEESIKNCQNEDLSGSTITFEDMIKKFDSEDKFLVKYKEQRDRVQESRIKDINNLPKLKICLEEKLKIYDTIENSNDNLNQYYKKLTDVEYNMQMLYGEKEDISYHIFWETPKCTCPKIDNLEIYPSENPIFDNNCPIHNKN